MRHHIDICSVSRGVLVVEGWCEQGVPAVLYNSQRCPTQWGYAITRPDLLPHFGADSDSWGFRVVADLARSSALHDSIDLAFEGGGRVNNPGVKFGSGENAEFTSMLESLRAAAAGGGRILEVGSRARSGNTYRHWFSDSVEHVGIDVTAGPCVDIVCDAHELSRHVTGRFDFAFSISVFEHLLMPWKVAIEMNRVLKPGALAYIQSHAAYPLHDEPWDFWRFSKDSWKALFNNRTGYEIVQSGHAQGCKISADYACGGPVEGIDSARSFLLSACLIRRTGDAKLEWNVDAAEVMDINYTY